MNRSKANACAGKVRHPTPEGGRVAALVTGRRTGKVLECYRCPHCNGYHVGHARKSVQRRVGYLRLLALIERANRKDE